MNGIRTFFPPPYVHSALFLLFNYKIVHIVILLILEKIHCKSFTINCSLSKINKKKPRGEFQYCRIIAKCY